MNVDITAEFLELVKKCPSDMTRTEFTVRRPHKGSSVHKYYDVAMKWVVGKTTIIIELRDEGSFKDDGDATLALMKIVISKKKWYNIFTDETIIHHSQVHKTHLHMLYNEIKDHYFGHTDWSPRGGDSISNYL